MKADTELRLAARELPGPNGSDGIGVFRREPRRDIGEQSLARREARNEAALRCLAHDVDRDVHRLPRFEVPRSDDSGPASFNGPAASYRSARPRVQYPVSMSGVRGRMRRI